MIKNGHAGLDLLTNETSEYLQPAQRLQDQPRPLVTKTLIDQWSKENRVHSLRMRRQVIAVQERHSSPSNWPR